MPGGPKQEQGLETLVLAGISNQHSLWEKGKESGTSEKQPEKAERQNVQTRETKPLSWIEWCKLVY